jgi:signal transduction histidine kinase
MQASADRSRVSAWVPLARLSPSQAALTLSLGTAVLAAAIVVAVAPRIPELRLDRLALFLVLVAAARLASLEMFDGSSYSVSTVPTLAAGMLLGVAGAVIVAPVSALVRGITRRSPWYKVLFNASLYVIAAAASTSVFDLMRLPVAPASLPLLLPGALAAGGAYFLHTLLVAGAIGTERRTPPLPLWREEFQWLWPHYLVMGAMALLLALAYDAFGLVGVLTFVAPPVLLRYVAKQYLDRTAAHTRELRALNEELTNEIRRRAAAEEESARLAREAGRAAALEEQSRLKSRFISVASHEMRTPLTAVLGYVAFALADTDKTDERHRMLTIAHDCAEQLARLVDDLLETSRLEVGQVTIQPAAVDLRAAIPPVLDALRASTPRHRFEIAVHPDADVAWVDPDKLRQMLTNLVSNAVKYSPEGGRVRVWTARRDATAVELAVADEGIGISAEDAAHVFDPYRRGSSIASRRIRGAGLGLFIVRSLAELHCGSIRVESTVGEGTTFYLTLPRPAQERELAAS